jgi:hypothetical protein
MNIFFDKCLRIDRKINKEEKKTKRKRAVLKKIVELN